MDKYTVLIIDDDNALRQLLTQILEILDLNIIEARSGTDGINVLQEHDGKVDLILLDVFMADMDGLEFLKYIKTMEAFNTIPIIMLTAATDKTKMIDAIRSGAKHYLTKPFNSEDLLTKVVQVLGLDMI